MEESFIESGSAQHKHQHPSLGINDSNFKFSENRAANEYEDDHDNDGYHDNDGDSMDGADVDDRVARSRDRNREHARRTRLRKKAQLQVLHNRVKDLQDENLLLSQTIEECSIASILLNLSSGGESADNSDIPEMNDLDDVIKKGTTDQHQKYFTSNGKRKRFISDACDHAPPPMKLKINGLTTIVGQGTGKAHINWKTGVYLDENGQQRQLSSQELETLRRERNRMHAKMTRDRKKVFISSVEKTIDELQEDNKRMRAILAKQALDHANMSVTPEPSPMLSSRKDSPSCSINSIPLLTAAAININPISKVVSPIHHTHVDSSSDSQKS